MSGQIARFEISAVDAIKAGAGRVLGFGVHAGEPMLALGMGWFVTCSDPHGDEFGLWQTDPTDQMPTG